MAVSPKRNAVMLQFFQHFKAYAVTSRVTFRNGPQRLGVRFCNLEGTHSTLCRKKSRSDRNPEYVVPVHQVLWL
jgi:hypothetical protein